MTIWWLDFVCRLCGGFKCAFLSSSAVVTSRWVFLRYACCSLSAIGWEMLSGAEGFSWGLPAWWKTTRSLNLQITTRIWLGRYQRQMTVAWQFDEWSRPRFWRNQLRGQGNPERWKLEFHGRSSYWGPTWLIWSYWLTGNKLNLLFPLLERYIDQIVGWPEKGFSVG